MTATYMHAEPQPDPDPVRRSRTRVVPLRSVVGLVLAAPILTWWAVGPLGREWSDYAYGPYHLPVGPLRAVGVGAAVVASAALVHIVRAWRVRAGQGGLALGTTTCLLVLGVAAAIGWRICTAGVVGANIGAGFILLVGPVLAAGLVVGAVLVECAARHVRPWRTTWLAGLALLTAPGLWAGEIALTAYDQGRGVITAQQFASVQVGDPRDGVRGRLGPRGEIVDWFFPAPPAGSTCDYWSGYPIQSPPQYRVCSQAGRVVVTQVSSDPYTPP